MIAWARIFCWRQMFHIRNLNPKSFWSQSHTRTTGALSRFYVLLRSLSQSQVLYWKWHSTIWDHLWSLPHLWAAWSVTAKGTRMQMDSWACQTAQLYCSPKWLLQLIFVIHLFNLSSIQCWNIFIFNINFAISTKTNFFIILSQFLFWKTISFWYF